MDIYYLLFATNTHTLPLSSPFSLTSPSHLLPRSPILYIISSSLLPSKNISVSHHTTPHHPSSFLPSFHPHPLSMRACLRCLLRSRTRSYGNTRILPPLHVGHKSMNLGIVFVPYTSSSGWRISAIARTVLILISTALFFSLACLLD
ncbi:hypothetical protein P280DRAFT_334108 [Massarina eburnea CBS 473.64]|uniref:Uncharacterized protein n=1 Tax=Massarina eburnea CBS 473.64 TaxID=1395130 RepID=A0A6A6S0B7_9PLEO|nr:hypothetical protein P280DRAFT_334108 [Massarina eburnea CBS 473.64]